VRRALAVDASSSTENGLADETGLISNQAAGDSILGQQGRALFGDRHFIGHPHSEFPQSEVKRLMRVAGWREDQECLQREDESDREPFGRRNFNAVFHPIDNE
jgi:hypothetical protein